MKWLMWIQLQEALQFDFHRFWTFLCIGYSTGSVKENPIIVKVGDFAHRKVMSSGSLLSMARTGISTAVILVRYCIGNSMVVNFAEVAYPNPARSDLNQSYRA